MDVPTSFFPVFFLALGIKNADTMVYDYAACTVQPDHHVDADEMCYLNVGPGMSYSAAKSECESHTGGRLPVFLESLSQASGAQLGTDLAALAAKDTASATSFWLGLEHDGDGCVLHPDKDFTGQQASNPQVGGKALSECCDVCKSRGDCVAFAWNDHDGGTCWLKKAQGSLIPAGGVTAGEFGLGLSGWNWVDRDGTSTPMNVSAVGETPWAPNFPETDVTKLYAKYHDDGASSGVKNFAENDFSTSATICQFQKPAGGTAKPVCNEMDFTAEVTEETKGTGNVLDTIAGPQTSSLHCATRCTRHSLCAAFNINTNTGDCELLEAPISEVPTAGFKLGILQCKRKAAT